MFQSAVISTPDGAARFAEIKRWTPQPGDVFVIETPEGFRPGEAQQIANIVRRYWPEWELEAKIVVLPPGCTASVLSAKVAEGLAVE